GRPRSHGDWHPSGTLRVPSHPYRVLQCPVSPSRVHCLRVTTDSAGIWLGPRLPMARTTTDQKRASTPQPDESPPQARQGPRRYRTAARTALRLAPVRFTTSPTFIAPTVNAAP